MNNKGFTLIELLAIIVLLAVIMSVGSYVVVTYIENSRNVSYDLLIENIKTGVVSHYEECLYNPYSTACQEDYVDDIRDSNSMTVTLGNLAKYGFLTSTEGKILDPRDNDNDITNCIVKVIRSVDSNYTVTYNVTSGSGEGCPSSEEYSND